MSQARTAGWGVLLSSPSRGCLLLFCMFSELLRFCCALCSWMFSRGSSREGSILCINNLGKNFSCKIRDQTIWWRTGKVGCGGGGGAFIPSSRKVNLGANLAEKHWLPGIWCWVWGGRGTFSVGFIGSDARFDQRGKS